MQLLKPPLTGYYAITDWVLAANEESTICNSGPQWIRFRYFWDIYLLTDMIWDSGLMPCTVKHLLNYWAVVCFMYFSTTKLIMAIFIFNLLRQYAHTAHISQDEPCLMENMLDNCRLLQITLVINKNERTNK